MLEFYFYQQIILTLVQELKSCSNTGMYIATRHLFMLRAKCLLLIKVRSRISSV